ncbi:glutamate 5-kinase [Tepidibacillus marianensis]|uniref:glutamate 5-kinase n=1 Tax=Tepidibacillus marianensis TaxID=3131995 RepID=UPI0030CD1232
MKKRIVIKIGSSSLTSDHGYLDKEKLNHYVKKIVELLQVGYEVVIVSSGAVAAGFHLLGYSTRPDTIEGKQAAAAIGQGLLVQAYNEAFQTDRYSVAQILLTRYDFANRIQYQNAYQTLSMLLKRGIVPIINENDSVAIDELTFGDNDRLSALVAGLIHADQLIILTDIDGLYDSDPRKNSKAKKLRYIEEITPEIEQLAESNGSSIGTGGMRSKLSAAKLALSFGVHVYIGKAILEISLTSIVNGTGNGTYLGNSQLSSIKTKQQWIAFHSVVEGSLIIDDGAVDALIHSGKSLLSAGIVDVRGTFGRGQVVKVISLSNQLIGKGIVNYSAIELQQIKGESSEVAMERFQVDRPEVIHRDDWVTLLEKGEEEELIYE